MFIRFDKVDTERDIDVWGYPRALTLAECAGKRDGLRFIRFCWYVLCGFFTVTVVVSVWLGFFL